MKQLTRVGLCLVAALGFVQHSHAALLAYEGFDYAAGTTFVSSNGGFGFVSGWQTNNSTAFSGMTNVAASLGYTDTFGHVLQTSGGSAYLTGVSGSVQPFRDLTNAIG